ncbi:hypothetical protein AAOE16_00100 [Ekhidna sp. MALMAid0563]|uniref:hypothetical protein n=1 Tax=Ekhidna sp. MALMAid0563 TaxID=3143937 RepID=UPI0032DE91C9
MSRAELFLIKLANLHHTYNLIYKELRSEDIRQKRTRSNKTLRKAEGEGSGEFMESFLVAF